MYRLAYYSAGVNEDSRLTRKAAAFIFTRAICLTLFGSTIFYWPPAWAYLWMVCQGLLTIAEKKVGLIDRTDRIDKSLFRLGLDWIHYSLKSNLDFIPIFRFQLAIHFLDVW